MALHVSLRDLYRLSGRGLGYPPGVIIDLARADSLGRDLIQTGSSSVNIALAHGFHDQSTMNRLFMRFVGLSPGFYRAAGRRPHR